MIGFAVKKMKKRANTSEQNTDERKTTDSVQNKRTGLVTATQSTEPSKTAVGATDISVTVTALRD